MGIILITLGDTEISFTEDVLKRMESYGFNTFTVQDGDNDIDSLDKALAMAVQNKGKPSFIKIRTTIGFGSKNQGTEKVHGAPLGAEDISNVKRLFGLDSNSSFHIPQEVAKFYEEINKKGSAAEAQWNSLFNSYEQKYPDLVSIFLNARRKRLKEDSRVIFLWIG